MHHRTEDLLSIRDDEPIEAATRARLMADPHSAAELARLQDVRNTLRALPELDPPPGIWPRVAARAAPQTAGRSTSALRWLGGAAIAATVATAAVLWLARSPTATDPAGIAPATAVARDTRQSPSPSPATAPAPDYAALVEESVRLDQLLARLPDQRSVMTAGTASTIVALEDRVSLIDGRLTIGAVEGLDPPQRQALWRERVDVMNALVQVRFAQAQRIVF